MPRLGLHLSVRQGFPAALRRAAALGAQTIQIFARHPRRWRLPGPDAETARAFRAEREKLGIHPLAVHSAYVPNLASSADDSRRRSVGHLVEELRRAEALGAEEFVIHAGAYSEGADAATGIAMFARSLREAADHAPGRVSILLENVAGGGRRLGSTIAEIAALLNALPQRRKPGVCLDVGHAWGAGWDLTSPAAIDEVLAAFDRGVGLAAVRVFHVHESTAEPRSGMDWHAPLGEGRIGLANLKYFFARAGRPGGAYILETPRENPGDDERNFALLKTLVG